MRPESGPASDRGLAEQLADQRWFGSKTREISHADVVEEIALAGDLRISFVEATFGAGTHETYQLLRDDSGDDVLAEHATQLLERIAGDADVAGGDSIVHFRGSDVIALGGRSIEMLGSFVVNRNAQTTTQADA